MATKTRTDIADPADAAVAASRRAPAALPARSRSSPGAAGNLGGEIARHYLSRGRHRRLHRTHRRAATTPQWPPRLADTGADAEPARAPSSWDGADAASCRAGIADILARHGPDRHPRQQRRIGRAEAAARTPAADRRRPRRPQGQRRDRYRDRRRRGAQHPRRRVEHGPRRRPGDGRGRIDHQRLDDLQPHPLLRPQRRTPCPRRRSTPCRAS